MTHFGNSPTTFSWDPPRAGDRTPTSDLPRSIARLCGSSENQEMGVEAHPRCPVAPFLNFLGGRVAFHHNQPKGFPSKVNPPRKGCLFGKVSLESQPTEKRMPLFSPGHWAFEPVMRLGNHLRCSISLVCPFGFASYGKPKHVWFPFGSLLKYGFSFWMVRGTQKHTNHLMLFF